MRPIGTSIVLELRRRTALALLKRGRLPHEVAKQVGVDRRSVRRWRAAYRRSGFRGVASRPVPGRPSRLSGGQRERLRTRLLAGAQACGFETALWTCPRVAQVIHRTFGIRYHADHVNRLLRGLGFTPQRPNRQPLERDPRKVRSWMGHTWVEAKKNSAA